MMNFDNIMCEILPSVGGKNSLRICTKKDF